MHTASRLELHCHPAAQRLDAVAQVAQSAACHHTAVHAGLEPDCVVFEAYADPRSCTVIGALEHLETTEVHRPGDLGRVVRLRPDLDACRDAGTHCRRA